ncbi:uncharacterized membrane protein YgdD (TMEM256/DUF423 family) [Paenibacillus shirakamiensis]|uniref:Uncharacterized membrane protein YgdD (TMEM256/DUF423 family) n=1 Tax=Paenibacillus shirakamiensis TaxID=1265935 RepID=A0ABS4JIH8_9BACL|nr:DUF423 domain-containing protein [Paenibacillus shirakamiensis]MBP2001515.1 uncharacterized membrane protein YgdD (TMEM256/DUF423 family) [Paenibacillus shirakamiensis]
MNTLLLLGAIFMFLAVALGAFGAHALKNKLSEDQLKVYQTGIQYHMAHSLALLILGIMAHILPTASNTIVMAGWFICTGIVLFSGSLYVLSLTGIRKLGAITPMGGLFFLAGWVVTAIAIINL